MQFEGPPSAAVLGWLMPAEWRTTCGYPGRSSEEEQTMILAQAVLSTILALARTCPVCRKRQVVPATLKRQSVRCRNCGAQIPAIRYADDRESLNV
jgi:hypothetical protein